MKVAELIDILNDLDPDAVIQMVIATPADENDETLTVELYGIDGVLPRRPDDEDGESVVWLIGGDEDDVEELIDAIDSDEEYDDTYGTENDTDNDTEYDTENDTDSTVDGDVVELVWDRD